MSCLFLTELPRGEPCYFSSPPLVTDLLLLFEIHLAPFTSLGNLTRLGCQLCIFFSLFVVLFDFSYFCTVPFPPIFFICFSPRLSGVAFRRCLWFRIFLLPFRDPPAPFARAVPPPFVCSRFLLPCPLCLLHIFSISD